MCGSLDLGFVGFRRVVVDLKFVQGGVWKVFSEIVAFRFLVLVKFFNAGTTC